MCRPGRLCASVLVGLALGGCGSTDTPSASSPTTATLLDSSVTAPPDPVGGLLATIGTNRLYALERGFGLGVRNVGEEPLVVRQLRLESPLFASVPLVAEEVLLQPGGRRFVLPIPYGEARCDGEPSPTFAAVVVVDDGEELRLPATEERPGAIGRLHERECAVAELRELADLRFGDEWTRDGDAVRGELVLEQRRRGEPVAVDDAVGSVVFTIRVDDDEPPILRVSDDEPMATVPITISGDRCDPHALAESKRTFLFLTWVTVGDGEPVPMDLEPTGAVRAALEEVLATCRD